MNTAQTNKALGMMFGYMLADWDDTDLDDSLALEEMRRLAKDFGLQLKEEPNQDRTAIIVSVYNDGEQVFETSFRKPGYKVLVAKVSFELRDVEAETSSEAIDEVRQSLPKPEDNELFLAKAYHPSLIVNGFKDIDLRTELQGNPGNWEEV